MPPERFAFMQTAQGQHQFGSLSAGREALRNQQTPAHFDSRMDTDMENGTPSTNDRLDGSSMSITPPNSTDTKPQGAPTKAKQRAVRKAVDLSASKWPVSPERASVVTRQPSHHKRVARRFSTCSDMSLSDSNDWMSVDPIPFQHASPPPTPSTPAPVFIAPEQTSLKRKHSAVETDDTAGEIWVQAQPHDMQHEQQLPLAPPERVLIESFGGANNHRSSKKRERAVSATGESENRDGGKKACLCVDPAISFPDQSNFYSSLAAELTSSSRSDTRGVPEMFESAALTGYSSGSLLGFGGSPLPHYYVRGQAPGPVNRNRQGRW
ncbi:hypothetical protein K402DRAFT_399180 [Aulographum hederae CBS 113979]|uniref:Uncharacterized protein n=1 Tax=Aulographum hederae CBS 113979 TaxID=1176131 RepID=A0A6G1GIU1_9PEZI|nr:hypothetical protein K402DRAFT_399180 [Aulographum hederae CBS 113979]